VGKRLENYGRGIYWKENYKRGRCGGGKRRERGKSFLLKQTRDAKASRPETLSHLESSMKGFGGKERKERGTGGAGLSTMRERGQMRGDRAEGEIVTATNA